MSHPVPPYEKMRVNVIQPPPWSLSPLCYSSPPTQGDRQRDKWELRNALHRQHNTGPVWRMKRILVSANEIWCSAIAVSQGEATIQSHQQRPRVPLDYPLIWHLLQCLTCKESTAQKTWRLHEEVGLYLIGRLLMTTHLCFELDYAR